MKYQVREKSTEWCWRITLTCWSRRNINETIKDGYRRKRMTILVNHSSWTMVNIDAFVSDFSIDLYFLVPIRRSSSFSPSRHRSQTAFVAAPRNNNSNFAVIGPNEKFASSQLYRLRQPVQDPGRVSKPKEYAILGRNEKFQDNVVYPLRKPVIDDTPAVSEILTSARKTNARRRERERVYVTDKTTLNSWYWRTWMTGNELMRFFFQSRWRGADRRVKIIHVAFKR